MLMMKNERRPALQTLRGWAISVLPETGREEYDWRRTVQIRIPTRWR
ncbi:hypothetical protein [Bradyrhizobium sp. AZCC 1721]